jgi:hypothetical protein
LRQKNVKKKNLQKILILRKWVQDRTRIQLRTHSGGGITETTTKRRHLGFVVFLTLCTQYTYHDKNNWCEREATVSFLLLLYINKCTRWGGTLFFCQHLCSASGSTLVFLYNFRKKDLKKLEKTRMCDELFIEFIGRKLNMSVCRYCTVRYIQHNFDIEWYLLA